MRKEDPRDSAGSRSARTCTKGVKRATVSADKTVAKKKQIVRSSAGESSKNSGSQADSKGKKKLLKPKVVLTKLKLSPGGTAAVTKSKQVKEGKKEPSSKLVKSKPKKVVVSKATKKVVKLENDSKRTTAAKIVRAVKDVKKARTVVASKMAKTAPKKINDSNTVKKTSGGSSISVVKKHNIVKRVNKMSGKKPCVVSVKISNAHSTVTLSVKQNKQVAKKDLPKGSKLCGGKSAERNTISILKKGIASRRKSTSKECTSQESTPSQSPTRDTSPVRSREGKFFSKNRKVDSVKMKKKLIKQSSIESKKSTDDKCENDNKDQEGKTEVIINETVKIKTENIGEDQNMEIEFTNGSERKQSEDKESKTTSCSEKGNENKESKYKMDINLSDSKTKSPLNEYSNLKSIDSTTSDEIPLETLKSKQKAIKQEKESDSKRESSLLEKIKKDSPKSDSSDNLPLCHLDVTSSMDKKISESVKQPKSKCMSKTDLRKIDQESVAKFKISSKCKEKLKDVALKNKIAKLVKKSKLAGQKQKNTKDPEDDSSDKPEQSRRRAKLLKYWNGPKRHRVASLNAIAKVHCLYENESRGALNDVISSAAALQRAIQESKASFKKMESKDKKLSVKKPLVREKKSPETVVTTRNLRTNPGVRSVGRNFDILNVISSTSLSSSSSEESSDSGEDKKQLVLQPSVKQKQQMIKKEELEQTTDDDTGKKVSSPSNDDSKEEVKKVKKRRRKRNELTMDLKDMVVRKRMASLNASAIMTASYSTEKKPDKKKEDEVKKERKKRKKQPSSPVAEESSADEDVIMQTTNNNQKLAVIVNQDTDVTITGVYVNSTTRSTHHEGYCSIAGMQYRISSTSHTQTEATAVATETVLHSDLPAQGPAPTVATTLAAPCQSYTPLSALSSMQPPGHPHHHPHSAPPLQSHCPPPLSPLQRRHGCSSAFTAPPPPQPPPAHDVHGYYQPAGPLISTHHLHHHSTTSSVTTKVPPPPTPTPPQESSEGETPDNPPPVTYRYGGQPYNYSYQYYPSPPSTGLQYPPVGSQQAHYHQELCYSTPSGYSHGYFPKGHYPPPAGYHRRYGPSHQYYPPQDFYPNPPPPPNPQPPPAPSSQQMLVAAPPTAPTSEGSYPPPPPQPYYPGYSAGPPPPCYSTHSPSSRGLFIDPAYQGCPCPMQSCPKNVHTGPLTGASKGSIKNHQATPLPPVALALPLEPPGALGPPSPARGSAGMPPPPSPALATARNPPQWADSPPAKPLEQSGLLTISKVVTDSVMLADQVDTLADIIPKTEQIKLEPEDIVKIEAVEEIKSNNRKRRKILKSPVDIKRPSLDTPCEIESNVQQELQERLITPKEELEKTTDPVEPEEPVVEKHLPLSDNGATVPVKNKIVAPVLNGNIPSKDQPKKRKSLSSSECEPPVKLAKCVNNQKVKKKNAVKRSKNVAEENVAPEAETISAVESLVKVNCSRNSKPVERLKSSCSPHGTTNVPEEDHHPKEEPCEVGKKKKGPRGKKIQEKTKADHLLRSHGKVEPPVLPTKERRLSKSGPGVVTKGCVAVKKALPVIDPSAESAVNLPGLRRSLVPKWSNGWSWEGTPFKAKVFLNMDDGPVLRTCYPAMRHQQGDVIGPRDCILLKSGPRKTDLPFVAKVAAMWENPEDGEMMVSLLWYYRPEHTEQGRRTEDIPDEIFASRHKDTNSVACIEDKCFVLTFNEYCRYRKSVRRLEESLTSGGKVVPSPDGGSYPRLFRQPPGRVSPDLVFFCRRVYDFRQKRILKNPC